MSALTQHGYLLLADISGYTSFVAGTELEHSQEILADLLGTICEQIESVLTIHKLEGDAVFAYVPQEKIARGEMLLEIIEATYSAFRDKQVSMRHATTCTCKACVNIPTLDLKFILHHGNYILQDIRGMREIVGSDVNIAHRLLKNKVGEATGWQAYALFTEAVLHHLEAELKDEHIGVEAYEHLGEVKTHSINLNDWYQAMVNERKVFLSDEEADIVFHVDFATPLSVTWEWFQNPAKRNITMGGMVHWYAGDRPKGRLGRGASNHCDHGKSVSTETVLDWKPFEYSTIESLENGRKMFVETDRFASLPDGGTRLTVTVKASFRLPRWIRKPICRFIMINVQHYDKLLLNAASIAAKDYEMRKIESDSGGNPRHD
ncbi:MAG TPA: hypothetical protein DCX53_03985 [Anaerolineae bacterium]|nr:hypothetical protein [Anaerolineae bacterium]